MIVKCILLSHLWLKLRTWIGNLSSTTVGFKNGHGQQYQMHGQQYQEYKENGDWEKNFNLVKCLLNYLIWKCISLLDILPVKNFVL